jgi:chromosome segregation ATPase
MQNRHQQVLRQKESERNEYATRLNTLSLQFAELNGAIGKSDTRLKLTIKELTDAFDSKRSEHARALADLQSSKKVLDEMRAALAASRDVGERQANKLKEIEARHSELQTDVGRNEATIDALKREIDLHKTQVKDLNALLVDRDQQIQAVMTQIEALYASRSWRMTRPFRVAKRFFSGLGNLPSSNR